MTDFIRFVQSYTIAEWAGVLGFVVYVTNYCLLSFRAIDSEHKLYFAMNLLAASLVLYSLTAQFNFASMLIQIFWIGVSILALVLRTHIDTEYKKTKSRKDIAKRRTYVHSRAYY